MKKLTSISVKIITICVLIPFLLTNCKQDEPACENCDPNIADVDGGEKILNPDVALPIYELTTLDFNQDGTNDVEFVFEKRELIGFLYAQLSVRGLNANKLSFLASRVQLRNWTTNTLTETDDSLSIPLARISGAGIDGSLGYGSITINNGSTKNFGLLDFFNTNTTQNTTNLLRDSDVWMGRCKSLNTDKLYIPVELDFNNDGTKNYGWIEISYYLDDNGIARYRLNRYAYHLIPNTAITAGRY